MSTVQLADRMARIADYRGTELYKLFVYLLDDLNESYRVDLETVTVERLPFVQGANAQVKALKRALIDADKDASLNFSLPKV